jgi:hypothetical protein
VDEVFGTHNHTKPRRHSGKAQRRAMAVTAYAPDRISTSIAPGSVLKGI